MARQQSTDAGSDARQQLWLLATGAALRAGCGYTSRCTRSALAQRIRAESGESAGESNDPRHRSPNRMGVCLSAAGTERQRRARRALKIVKNGFRFLLKRIVLDPSCENFGAPLHQRLVHLRM